MTRVDKVFVKKTHRVSHGYTAEPAHRVDARIALNRMRNLGLLFNACGRDEERLAEFLLLPISRVRGLLDGETMISNELAMHIESQAELPEGWLDKSAPTIPDAVLARARGAAPEPVAEAGVPAASEAQHTLPVPPVVEALTVAEAPAKQGQSVEQPVPPQPESAPPAPATPRKRKLVSKTGKHIGRPFTVSLETAEARRHALRAALDSRGKGARMALAKEIGVGLSVVSSWLSGRRRITDTWAAKIAKALPEADMRIGAPQPQCATYEVAQAQAAPSAETPVRDEVAPEVGADAIETLRGLIVRMVSQQKDPVKLARVLVDIL